MAREIGIDKHTKHQCVFCKQSFDSYEFKTYMLKGSSQKIKCTKCGNVNSFVEPDKLSRAAQTEYLRAQFFIYFFIVILSPLLATFFREILIKFKLIERELEQLWLFLVFAALIALYLGSLYKKRHKWQFFEIKKTKSKEHSILRECAFCEESFDSPEFWNYILHPNTNKIKCIRCENTSFFARPDKISKKSKIASFVLFVICLLPYPLVLALFNYYKKFKFVESLGIGVLLGYALLISMLFTWLSIKLYNWNFSELKKD